MFVECFWEQSKIMTVSVKLLKWDKTIKPLPSSPEVISAFDNKIWFFEFSNFKDITSGSFKTSWICQLFNLSVVFHTISWHIFITPVNFLENKIKVFQELLSESHLFVNSILETASGSNSLWRALTRWDAHGIVNH